MQAASIYSSPLAWLAVLLWSGGRMRALQEFGHNAVHFALCRHHGWQWWLSNVFYQFPMFKRDMRSHQTHTLEHHRHPNHPELDPNRARVQAGGYVAGLSPSGFYGLLLYPLTPRGAWVNLTTLVRSSLLNHSRLTTLARCLSVAAVAALLYAFGGWKGMLFGWLLPLLTSYPVFAWISLLTEHRWVHRRHRAQPPRAGIPGGPAHRLLRDFRLAGAGVHRPDVRRLSPGAFPVPPACAGTICRRSTGT
ncbi:fatty acid desaturase [Pseudomonas chlororaphis]|uniref:fatty acid desaturase n=1 Tax=Pseudomonas chlororaphis TaxID=587753 RepID=UPI000AB9517C|nr:fatty acid desaturase [Pseudomonas chlororaphis]